MRDFTHGFTHAVIAAFICLTLVSSPARGEDPGASGAQAAAGQSAQAAAGKEPAARTGGLTQGSASAFTLPAVTVYGVADQPPVTPVTTRFGTQFNVVTEEQIRRQGSLDFYDALRNVPGVMYQKKNIIGGQTSHSLYIRGRGAGHPSPDLSIFFDDVPRSGLLYGQALADGIPVYALGGMEIYKYPQPSRFGTGYGMVNFVPRHMTEEGFEARFGIQGGSYGTFAENVGLGMKKDMFDIYAAQSRVSTDGHVPHSSGWQDSYYMNVGAQMGEHLELRLLGNYVNARTEAPDNPLTGARAAPRRFDTETGFSTLTLSNRFDKASGYVKGYYNNTEFWLIGESNNTRKSKQSVEAYGLRARETFSLWEGGEFTAGFDLDRMVLTNRQYAFTGGTLSTWDFPDQTVFSPYLAFSQLFGDREGLHFIPSAGLRYYRNNVFENKLSPQAGLVFGYGGTDLSFNYARGVNYPSPVVLQGFLQNTSLPAGLDTKKIKPEIVDHYEIALSHSWEGLASVSGTWFYDSGRDRTRAYMGPGNIPDASLFNSTTARYRIRGVELAGSLTPIEDLEFFAGATWLKAKAVGEDGIMRNKMPYTPTFTFQAGFKWDFLEHFSLSGDYQHLQGVYVGTSGRGTSSSGTGRPASNFAAMSDANKLKDIDLVNLRLDWKFAYDPIHLKEGRIFVAVDNILDSDYAYAKEITGTNSAAYDMPGTTYMVGLELRF
ncbi:MAG: TonB-dependent receptor plug domain-containing protein [Desulfovibrio sp.]|jgi:iron complex outermembrane receptor protein|nr:TonB-dependent receptor plug domain-containing protein [Desulfovibrio sp.]